MIFSMGVSILLRHFRSLSGRGIKDRGEYAFSLAQKIKAEARGSAIVCTQRCQTILANMLQARTPPRSRLEQNAPSSSLAYIVHVINRSLACRCQMCGE